MSPQLRLLPVVALVAACSNASPPIADARPTGTDATASIASASPSPSSASRASDGAPRPATPKVRVDLHVMSTCPFGTAFENTLGKLRKNVDLDLHVDYIGKIDKDGIHSLRGEDEAKGDLVQVCAADKTPQWFDVILCQNEDLSHIATSFRHCAEKLGLAPSVTDDIERCAAGDQGKKLLAASFERSASRNVSGSPTVYFDSVQYTGARGRWALFKHLCDAWGSDAPETCAHIPTYPVVVLEDARCEYCRKGDALTSTITRRFENAVVQEVDVSDKAAEPLLAALDGKDLPAVMFDASNLPDEAVDVFARLSQQGPYRVLSVGDWNPRCADDGGCRTEACSSRLFCQVETPLTLDLYMMGRCPYARSAVEALGEVLENFKKNKVTPTLRFHFIGDTTDTGFTSMHGAAEVDDDLRDVCAIQHYPKDAQYLGYMRCRAKDYDADWKTCTDGKTGFDSAVLETCATGDEGKQLLTTSFQESKTADIATSPTWIVNGRFRRDGNFASGILAGFCAHNKVGGCDAKLSTEPPYGKPKAPPSAK